ncbi:hypothetical protein GCM10027515_18320 [Schumannella luteola]
MLASAYTARTLPTSASPRAVAPTTPCPRNPNLAHPESPHARADTPMPATPCIPAYPDDPHRPRQADADAADDDVIGSVRPTPGALR